MSIKIPACNHKGDKLKCNYHKFVDFHLQPYRCKVTACENARFSSTGCLLSHEREAHAMHNHGEKPFLCPFQGCERGILGSGFPRHWNPVDHMRPVHNRSPSPPLAIKKQDIIGSMKCIHDTPPPGEFAGTKPSPAQKQFPEKAEELIAITKKIRNAEGKDAHKRLRAAEDCLKVLY